MAKRGPQYSQKEHRRASWYHDAPGGYSKRGGKDSDNFGEQRTVNRETLGNHRRQSQHGRLELGLRLSD
jgi:hypothetical protein